MLTTLAAIAASVAVTTIAARFALAATKASPVGHSVVWGLLILSGLIVPVYLGNATLDLIRNEG